MPAEESFIYNRDVSSCFPGRQ